MEVLAIRLNGFSLFLFLFPFNKSRFLLRLRFIFGCGKVFIRFVCFRIGWVICWSIGIGLDSLRVREDRDFSLLFLQGMEEVYTLYYSVSCSMLACLLRENVKDWYGKVMYN